MSAKPGELAKALGVQGENLFPDGAYDLVDGQRLHARTKEGARLVRILSTSAAPTFLLVDRRDKVHEDYVEETRRLTQEKAALWRQVRDLTEALEDHKRGWARSDKDREVAEEAMAALRKEHAVLIALHETMEADMATVREQIGEKAWKDALAQEYGP